MDGRSYTIAKMKEKTQLLNSKEEEYRLLKLAQEGDEEARNKMIESNVRLVASFANRYSRFSNVPWEDLFQEGTLGLFTAIAKFDLSRGLKFSTYASWWVMQACSKTVYANGMIRVPSKLQDIYNAYVRLKIDYEKEFRETPLPGELAPLLGVTEKRLQTAIDSCQGIYSTDSFVNHDTKNGTPEEGTMTYQDLIVSEAEPAVDTVFKLEVKEQLDEALATLSDRERAVFDLLSSGRMTKQKARETLIRSGTAKSVAEVDRIYRVAIKRLQNFLGDNPYERDYFEE